MTQTRAASNRHAPLELSRATRRAIDWQRIMNAVPAVALSSVRDGAAEGKEAHFSASGASAGPTDQDAKEVFDTVAAEFDRILSHTTRLANVVVVASIAAMVLSVAGLAIYTFLRANMLGLTFNVVGVAAMFAMMRKLYALANDQALLRLTPQKYRLALEFVTTPEQRMILINQFLEETRPRR